MLKEDSAFCALRKILCQGEVLWVFLAYARNCAIKSGSIYSFERQVYQIVDCLFWQRFFKLSNVRRDDSVIVRCTRSYNPGFNLKFSSKKTTQPVRLPWFFKSTRLDENEDDDDLVKNEDRNDDVMANAEVYDGDRYVSQRQFAVQQWDAHMTEWAAQCVTTKGMLKLVILASQQFSAAACRALNAFTAADRLFPVFEIFLKKFVGCLQTPRSTRFCRISRLPVLQSCPASMVIPSSSVWE